MNKKYIVRLSQAERDICVDVIKNLKGTSQTFRRAQILLKVDVDGPAWIDQKICEAFDCRVQTVENIRKQFVLEGFEATLERKKRPDPPTPAKLDGKQEAKLIALRLGKPHTIGAFYEAFPAEKAREYVRKINFVYTPKHGSWLNVAERELSCMTSQCLAGRRIGELTELQSAIKAWADKTNSKQRGVEWQFKINNTQTKLTRLYPKIEM